MVSNLRIHSAVKILLDTSTVGLEYSHCMVGPLQRYTAILCTAVTLLSAVETWRWKEVEKWLLTGLKVVFLQTGFVLFFQDSKSAKIFCNEKSKTEKSRNFMATNIGNLQ